MSWVLDVLIEKYELKMQTRRNEKRKDPKDTTEFHETRKENFIILPFKTLCSCLFLRERSKMNQNEYS